MTSQPFILCDNLIKIYRIAANGGQADASLEVQALQGLDLTVAEGEMIGLVGASGSGKSTLLNILGGLDRPTGGRALVDQHDLGKLSQRELDVYRRQTVGFVWQYGARNLIPYLTAIENIQLPMTLAGRMDRKSHERSVELLKLVGLRERMEHRLEELSGGEQQRVAVAIALANRPRLLLADEPTGELDTQTAKTIYDLFRQLNRKLGLTIVIVSHDASIARHVDRVVAIRDGKLAAETVRVKPASSKGRRAQSDEHKHVFEELIVLDSAGRLAVPHEYLEKFHIRRRVRLEVTEEGILLRPPETEQAEPEQGQQKLKAVSTPEAVEDQEPEPIWLKRSTTILRKLSDRFPFLPFHFSEQHDEKKPEGQQ